MPLLSRHKSTNSTTTSAPINSPKSQPIQKPQQQQQQQQQPQQQQQQLCESPLFGFRRQLPISPISQETGRSSNDGSPLDELNSIPQQITRQQIHYAFSIMDYNKDGMIDVRDLSQMLANLGLPIDESVLSHIMSTVSKRGDHRISEAEFLDWISHFIQISDSQDEGQQGTTATSQQAASRATVRQQASAKTKVSRASTAGSSLMAQQSEVPRGSRRGSGSGLVLMRSLSASSAPTSSSESTTPTKQQRQQQQKASNSPNRAEDLEACNDLKAAFGVFDLDGDGFITLDEVHAGLKLLGESWTPNELRQLFSRCSTSGQSGDQSTQKISIEEFVRLLL